jgi:CubicO group peptidase (beta-lactamase class C family)
VARALLLALITAAALPRSASAQYEPLDALVQDGIRRGVYPAAALIVGNSHAILHARGFGHFTWSERSAVPTPDSTLWDIASLTKVVATTASVALLVDQGKLALDAPVERYLPRFTGGDRPRVTVRMLLDHTSGLPAGLPPAQRRVGRDSLIGIIDRIPLRTSPGAASRYSDLNAILLGLIVEKVGGRPLDRFAAEAVFTPLDMRSTRFLPPAILRPRIAPTAQWHGTPLSGIVNDRTSDWLGGVAGHAGLFSTASDLARYAQWWLRRGVSPSGTALLRPATIDTFLYPGSTPRERLLGWESRTTSEYTPSPYGSLLSAGAYGHTGYTGTMIIIDPAHDLFVIFLTLSLIPHLTLPTKRIV